MLKELSSERGWDRPFFKRLAHNDTGVAAGHQGGIVVPKGLREFLPGLHRSVESDHPTVDRRIRVDLVVDGKTVSRVQTRYQFQTWGGTRSAESRITGNIGVLRNTAVEGDYLVFQRSQNELDLYRLILVGRETDDHRWIQARHASARWGLLTEDVPVTESDLMASRNRQEAREKKPFSLFDQDAQTVTKETTRLARSLAFRQSMIELYGGACTICRQGLRAGDSWEIEGAHIVPRHRYGSDDARNGLALCRTHHWAFDNGLLGIDFEHQILVPDHILAIQENKSLAALRGVRLLEPRISSLAPHNEAIEWHIANTLRAV